MKKTLLMASLLLGASGTLYASDYTTADLGGDLTPWGAIKAGNADGSIPAYTGGLTQPPASYDSSRPGWRPDPFADDQPVLRITAQNMAEHADKLSPGVMALMRKYDTFFIDVYPTRRSVAYPQSFLDNSMKNVDRCQTVNGELGLDTSTGCGFGIPFPVPEDGLQVMWNHGAGAYRTAAFLMENFIGLYVKPSGEVVRTYNSNSYRYQPFYDTRTENPDAYYAYRYEYIGPARLAGTTTLTIDMIKDSERRAWTYSPATRRVRLSPDSAADTPVSQVGGAMTFDDDRMFAGKKDRYEWELVGRKEMYIPYNNFRNQYTEKDDTACYGDAKLTAGHPKAECVRWELHRVWHVRGTLKDGERHVYSRRDLFIDEDSYSDGLSDMYDQAGNIYRVNLQIGAPLYEQPAASVTNNTVIDLISGVYTWGGSVGGQIRVMDPLPPAQMAPASLSRQVLR